MGWGCTGAVLLFFCLRLEPRLDVPAFCFFFPCCLPDWSGFSVFHFKFCVRLVKPEEGVSKGGDCASL